MKRATLACLLALCLSTASAHAAPGDPVAADQPGREQGTAPQKPAPAKAESSTPRGEKAEAPREGTKDGARAEKAAAPATGRDRRRPSYAACNRASHQRGYRGGRRRRFLIRCRLGYERPRPAQHQTAPAPAPVRRP